MRYSVLAFAVLAASPACVLLSSSDSTVQCASDDDCSAIGGRCDMSANVCVVPQEGPTATSSGEGPTTTSTGAGGGGEPTGCQSTSQCIDDNGLLPYVCPEVGGSCIPLETEVCPEFFGDIDDLRDANPIFIGLFHQYEGETEEDTQSGVLARNGVRLALEEIEGQTTGLPVGENNARRHLFAIGCEVTKAEMATEHLLAVGANAVMTRGEPEDVTFDVVANLFYPAGLFGLVQGGRSRALVTLEDDGLLWLPNYLGHAQGASLAALLAERESDFRAILQVPKGEPIRLAEVVRADPSGTTTSEAFESALAYNDRSLSQNIDDGLFLRVDYDPGDDISELVTDLLAFEPHVVVSFQANTEVPGLVDTLERSIVEGNVRPLYLADDSAYDYPTTQVLNALIDDGIAGAAANRFYGTRPYLPPIGQEANYTAFNVRYRARFNNQTTGSFNAPVYYDGVYLLAYAMIAAGQVPALNGRAIAGGFTELDRGAVINAGPNSIGEAISVLKAGATIDFEGVYQSYDFDAQYGTAEPHFATYCYRGGQISATSAMAQYYFNPETDGFDGELGPCNPVIPQE